jgi:hypothetical protein
MPKFMPYGRRKNRRAAKKALKKRNKRFLKSYNYKFKLPQQVLVCSQTTGGQFNVFSDSTSATPGPLLQTNINFTPSLTGFTGATDCGWSTTHKLSDCEYFSKYVDLYDAYKINTITLELEYLNNTATASDGGLMPTAYLAMDQDSAVSPTALIDVQGYQGVLKKSFGSGSKDRVMKFKWRPYIGVGTQSNAGGVIGNHAVVTKAPWLDCVQPDVPHYALKCWLTDLFAPGGALPGVQNGFRLQWTYDISFRSPTDAA